MRASGATLNPYAYPATANACCLKRTDGLNSNTVNSDNVRYLPETRSGDDIVLGGAESVSFQISKSVPLPDDVKPDEGGTQTPGRPWKYPWPLMEKGDSVLFTDPKEGFRSSLSHWKTLHADQRWVIRRIDGCGLRVWRVR